MRSLRVNLADCLLVASITFFLLWSVCILCFMTSRWHTTRIGQPSEGKKRRKNRVVLLSYLFLQFLSHDDIGCRLRFTVERFNDWGHWTGYNLISIQSIYFFSSWKKSWIYYATCTLPCFFWCLHECLVYSYELFKPNFWHFLELLIPLTCD